MAEWLFILTSWFTLVVVMLHFQRVSLCKFLVTTEAAELLFIVTSWFTLLVVVLYFCTEINQILNKMCAQQMRVVSSYGLNISLEQPFFSTF